jgi:hypothetical protein
MAAGAYLVLILYYLSDEEDSQSVPPLSSYRMSGGKPARK